MSITSTEFLEDKVVVGYHLSKPYGMPDESGKKEIPNDSICNLPPVPIEPPGRGMMSTEEVFVPRVRRTLVFIFDSYQERCMGPNEEDIYGPFLKPEGSDGQSRAV